MEVRFIDSGYYTCLTKNLNENSKYRFYLQILIPPFFYEHQGKAHVSVFENENITLECLVNGYPTPSVINIFSYCFFKLNLSAYVLFWYFAV